MRVTTMEPTLEQLKAQALPILRKHKVAQASFYGSRVRGDARSDSDLDLMVKLPRGSTLFDLARLNLALEAKLGVKVDLATYAGIDASIRDQVRTDEVRILG